MIIMESKMQKSCQLGPSTTSHHQVSYYSIYNLCVVCLHSCSLGGDPSHHVTDHLYTSFDHVVTSSAQI